MKYFIYDEKVDRQMIMIQVRIRQRMNGDVARQLTGAGLDYQKLYGVSLIHLREISQEFKPCNALAEQLWHKGIRETMILATMVANREQMEDAQVMQWADSVSNIELAEQVAFNLLGKRKKSHAVIDSWLFHSGVYVRYAALMSVGWQFRFIGGDLSGFVEENMSIFNALIEDSVLSSAVTHCMRMAGRFDPVLKPKISRLADEWIHHPEKHIQEAGKEVLFELGSF